MEMHKVPDDSQNKENRNDTREFDVLQSLLSFLAFELNNSFLILNKAKSVCNIIINLLLTKLVGY